MNILLRHLCGLSMILLLAACGSAPTRIHTLLPVSPTFRPAGYDGPPLRVAAVHLPPAFDRLEIVTEQGPGEWQIHDSDHWAAPLGKLAQQTLSADLLARLPAGKVVFPRLPAGDTSAELRIDLLLVPAGSANHWMASWQLVFDPHMSRTGLIDLKDAPHAGSPDALAHALSDLLAQLADQLAQGLAQTASPDQAH